MNPKTPPSRKTRLRQILRAWYWITALNRRGMLQGARFCAGLIGFLCVLNPLTSAADAPEMFYYLAVPSCPGKGECVSVACIRLDRNGVPVGGTQRKGKSFYSIWYSGSWQERTSGAPAKLTMAEKVGNLPAPLARFFVEVEKLRAASAQPIILQPLFKPPFSMRWEHVPHLNVLAMASNVSPEARSKALIASFQEPRERDPAKSLLANLAALGIKTRSLQYWPEINVFLIEAEAKFAETIEILFSPLE